MTSNLRYGVDSSFCLDIPADVLLAYCDAPRGRPLDDVLAAARAALAEPLHAPPFLQAAVPGDSVVLALDHGVPQSAAIVAALVETFVAAGVEAKRITILRTAADADADAGDPRGELPDELGEQVVLATHDPASRQQLSYLAASSEGKPIYINRSIGEADVVVPIGCLRLEESCGYRGVGGNLFPTFSDAKSIERYRAFPSVESPVQGKRMRNQAEEVAWLLGVLFTVQVVPGAGEDVLHVLAGELNAVRQRGGQLCAAAWRFSVPRRASLVVATIEGNSGQQNWENVGRALAAASRAVADDGAIALCTDLEEGLGPGLQQLVGADDLRIVSRQITKERPADALAASQLLRALEHGRVYLLSRLDENLVEELGIAPVADGAEISRLASRHESCTVLANAQFALATPADESD